MAVFVIILFYFTINLKTATKYRLPRGRIVFLSILLVQHGERLQERVFKVQFLDYEVCVLSYYLFEWHRNAQKE